MTGANQRSVPIDELDVFEAYDAREPGGTIECPNGCYDPVEITSESLEAAARLPTCKECDSKHLVQWSEP